MRSLGRWVLWMVLAGIALQLFFVARIAAMVVVDPTSTSFMRSEAWRIAGESLQTSKSGRWSHQWVADDQISPHLKRAVIASEDAGFTGHGGVDWEAIEGAWQKNERRQQLAEKRAARQPLQPVREPKVVGGSTITQQLAKNLLLSGERQLFRKGQELLLTLMLEALLDKRRILEIYLNSVEWGDGIFGAEAASQRYFNKPASRLSPHEAARLAVMLPSPKFFETRQGSAYLARRTGTIVARMGGVALP
jgi:monofunctional biosynthetic peptidoglycan transglycosylase